MNRAASAYPVGRISLREVGLRDGLQLVKAWPSTEAKLNWLAGEYAAGVRHFEVGSFLPAARFPQFADLRAMIDAVSQLEGARSAALALNERGLADAFDTAVDEVVCVVSATEEHSQANMRRSRADAIELVRKAARLRDETGHKAIVNAGIAMALGCSIAGAVDPEEVLRLTERCLDAGADVIGIADTVGYAGPRAVGELTARVKRLAPETPVVVHLHDTRGMGIANAAGALDAGADILDGSLGGLGGCPFAPGATGNVVFEDLVFLCEEKGFATGVDIPRLLAVRKILESEMQDEPLHGGLARAGLPGRAAAA